MARGPEGDFWKRVRAAWPGHAVRIEASRGEVDEGTPDVVLSVQGCGGFVELKVFPDDVSPQQLAWHLDAIEKGAYAMVLADVGGGKVWLGTAETWHYHMRLIPGLARQVVRDDGGMLLQEALYVIACALIGNRKSRRRM